MIRSARAAVAEVAAHGLDGDESDERIEVDSLDQLLIVADTQRVTSHLDRAAAAGRFPDAPPDWLERVRDRAIAAAETTLIAHASAMSACRDLAGHGIPAVLIKGCATGPLDYERPVDRFSSDVDLLVQGEHLGRAVELLGRRSDEVVRRTRWHRRFGHARTVVDELGVEVDLHVRINHGYVGLVVPTHELVVGVETFELGGQRVFSLDSENRFLVAAVHTDGPHRSLHAMRDVAQLVLDRGVDWQRAVERSIEWRIDTFVAAGVMRSWSALGLDRHPVVEWAAQHRSSGRQRVLARLPEEGLRRQVLAGPLALPLWEWPNYVGPLLFPSRDYVRHTGKDWRQRARIVGRELGRG